MPRENYSWYNGIRVLRKGAIMFSVIGKIVAILFIVTFGLVLFAFGFGWLSVFVIPLFVLVLPILLVIFIVVKVIRA